MGVYYFRMSWHTVHDIGLPAPEQAWDKFVQIYLESYTFPQTHEEIINLLSLDLIMLSSMACILIQIPAELARAEQVWAAQQRFVRAFLASEQPSPVQLSFLTTSYCFASSMTSVGYRTAEARQLFEEVLAVAAKGLDLPDGQSIGTIDITNASNMLRALYASTMSTWFTDFGAETNIFTIRAQITNFRATVLLLEADPARRRQMGVHFTSQLADSREFSLDIGRQDLVFALHGSIMARVSEACLLIGDTESALQYSNQEVTNMSCCCAAHIAAARMHGLALAASGDGTAALACRASFQPHQTLSSWRIFWLNVGSPVL